MKLVKNQFYKWTASDTDGEFVHSGQYIGIDDGDVLLNTDHGIMGIPKGDGVFVKTRKTKGARTVELVKPKPTPKQSYDNRPGGKVGQVIELLVGEPGISRGDAILKIVAAGISSAAGASTHFNKAKGYL